MDSMQGGDLYQLQQEAIVRARQTASRAVAESVHKEESGRNLSAVFKSDNMPILAILLLLMVNGCEDKILILALLLLLIL